MNGLDLQPQAPPQWMQLAPVAPMQQQGGGMGDLASALTGKAMKKLTNRGGDEDAGAVGAGALGGAAGGLTGGGATLDPSKLLDAPLKLGKSPLDLLGAIGGLA